MFKVKIANNCEEQFCNSSFALTSKLHANIESFTRLYDDAYNIKLDSGYLIFESEERYTWFVLRWS
jgi:hypothetical protein